MIEQIDKLIEDLTAARPHVTKLAEAEEARAGVQADLAATTEQLASAKAELETAHAGLSKAQVVAQKEHDEAIYSKQQELKSLQGKIIEAKTSLDDLTSRTTSKQSLHDQLEASIHSLRKKFA